MINSFQTSLQLGTGAVTVTYPGGRRASFVGSGPTYTSPAGNRDRLVANVDGSFDLLFIKGGGFHYGSDGQLTSETDRYGNSLICTYSGGKLSTVSVPGGRYLAFSYNASNRIQQVSDSAGRSVTYGYDSSSNLTTVTDPNGKTTSYHYDSAHQITSVNSPQHPAVPFVKNFYSGGQVTTQTDSYGSTMTLSYDPTLKRTSITDNRGYSLYHYWDSAFRLKWISDPIGFVAARTYNSKGLQETATDQNGQTTTLGYDANGNLVSVGLAGEGTRTASFDLANNNIVWSEDESGTQTTYTYDTSKKLLTQVTNPVQSINFDYFSNGLLKDIWTGDATSSLAYDASGRLATSTDPLGYSSTLEYDSAGRVATSTDPLGRTAHFVYDPVGHMLSATVGTSTAAFVYDADGNETTATDPLGHTTTFGYDGMDRLVAVTDAAGKSTTCTYDRGYNVSAITDARGKTTAYTHDANDRLASKTDALGHSWNYLFDPVGNLSLETNPDGRTATRSYTARNQLASLTLAGGPRYSYRYTPTGLLSAGWDDSGRTWATSYNSIGWVTHSSDWNDPSGEFAVSYSEDAHGRVTLVDTGLGRSTNYDYNARGDLTTLTASGAVTSYSYDPAGGCTSVVLPEGSRTANGYDAAGRLTSVTTTTGAGDVLNFIYSRDAARNVTSENGARFTYDTLDRLASWYNPSTNTTTTYDYDAAYNLTTVTVGAQVATSFAYDAADRITNPGYAFDANGNMASDGTRSFRYDALNRLTTVLNASTNATIASYAYDLVGRRISSTNASGTTYYHYDGANVIAETDGSGNTIASYTYGAGGQIHSMTRDGGTYYYIRNGHGDIVALTNSQGTVVNSYSYDPWGKPTTTSESVPNPYRYGQYRYDADTGLYCMPNRYFSPTTCRFITKDLYPGTLRVPSSLNPYVYCSDNPVTMADPSGLLQVGGYTINLGEGFGSQAVDYWATKSIDPSNAWYETAFDTFMGGLAALWTPCNSAKTALTLGTAWIAAPAIADLGGPGLLFDGPLGTRLFQIRSLGSGAPLLRIDSGWVPSMGKALLHLHLWPIIREHLPWDWFQK